MTTRKPVVCSFESRRADEMTALISKLGGIAVSAPAMREIPLEDNPVAIDAMRQMINGRVDVLVLQTGVGAEALLQLAETQGLKESLLEALKKIPVIARGPKPAAVLRSNGLTCTAQAPEPNTWREVLQTVQEVVPDLHGKTVAVQEYGISNPDLHHGLEQLGATVLAVPVYRWELPEDTQPVLDAIRKTIDPEIDILLFTSAQQVRNVLQIADQANFKDAWLQAAAKAFIGSIGPTCTEALKEAGLEPAIEAQPPKMGPLVRDAIEKWKAQAD